MTLDDLIALLEKAEGPSRELDEAIAVFHKNSMRSPDQKTIIGVINCQPFTSSIDAALTLVPEGVNDWDFRCRNSVAFKATLYRPSREYEGRSPVLAIALCIAALKARKEQP